MIEMGKSWWLQGSGSVLTRLSSVLCQGAGSPWALSCFFVWLAVLLALNGGPYQSPGGWVVHLQQVACNCPLLTAPCLSFPSYPTRKQQGRCLRLPPARPPAPTLGDGFGSCFTSVPAAQLLSQIEVKSELSPVLPSPALGVDFTPKGPCLGRKGDSRAGIDKTDEYRHKPKLAFDRSCSAGPFVQALGV